VPYLVSASGSRAPVAANVSAHQKMSKRRYKPSELFEKYREIRAATSDEDFFGRPEHKRTQELWCAAHFANAYDQYLARCMVLIDESTTNTDADFDLETSGAVFPFQLAEVQEPGRRRGDEYKQPERLRPVHDLSRGAVLGPQWVRDGIQKKAAKHYVDAQSLNLLIYLNFPAWQQQYHDIQNACAKAAESFGSVWLLNGNTMCVIKPNSELPAFEGWLVIPESVWHDESSKWGQSP